MPRKTKSHPLSRPANTVPAEPTDASLALADAFNGDVSALPDLVPRVDDKHELFWHEHENGDEDTLSLMAKAVAVDSENSGCLHVPLLHRLGVPLDAVDRDGRTLLHFAQSLPVFRYLVEHGAPVPDGARDRLQEVMAPHGLHLALGKGETVAFPDHRGALPPLVEWRLRGVTSAPDDIDPVRIPQAALAKTLRKWLLKSLRSIGYRDPGAMEAAGFVFSVADEMKGCMNRDIYKDEAFGPLRQLVALDLLAGLMPMWTAWGRDDDDFDAWMTPQGFAAVRDAEAGEAYWLKAFPKVSLNGVHAEGGRTLLHLADDPKVCAWLLERGVAADVADEEGRFPDDVLPEETAVLARKARLNQTLPAAPAASARRRL
jgi:hypothetical protein